ncbi:MAG: hypothetical protein AAB481_00145 [Patescibacteria group bacterium]
METPAPTSFTRRHKLLFGVIVTVGILLYAAFNVWVYQYSTSGKGSSSPAVIRQAVTSPGAGFNVLKGNSLPKQGVTFTGTPAATPTPTPRPAGPGQYACSPEGTCNVYSDGTRKQYCTTTYADNRCLDQCGDKEKQCKK